MTLEIVTTSLYKKDYKRLKKRGLDVSRLDDVVRMLSEEEVLPSKYRDHQLLGDLRDFREVTSREIGFLFTR